MILNLEVVPVYLGTFPATGPCELPKCKRHAYATEQGHVGGAFSFLYLGRPRALVLCAKHDEAARAWFEKAGKHNIDPRPDETLPDVAEPRGRYDWFATLHGRTEVPWSYD